MNNKTAKEGEIGRKNTRFFIFSINHISPLPARRAYILKYYLIFGL